MLRPNAYAVQSRKDMMGNKSPIYLVTKTQNVISEEVGKSEFGQLPVFDFVLKTYE